MVVRDSGIGREYQADATNEGSRGSRSVAGAERSEAPEAGASADRSECGLPIEDSLAEDLDERWRRRVPR